MKLDQVKPTTVTTLNANLFFIKETHSNAVLMRCENRRASFIEDITAIHAVAYRFVTPTNVGRNSTFLSKEDLDWDYFCSVSFGFHLKKHKAKPSTKTNPLRTKTSINRDRTISTVSDPCLVNIINVLI